MGTMEGAEEVMSNEKIFVSVRVRPLNEKEISNNDVSDWECINDKTIFYKNANVSVSERSMYPSAYTFDRVFGSGCSTKQVYERGAKEVALSAVRGINSSVFAYGQTSSGKTYTMTGITEYTIEDIYEYIQKHTEREFLLKFSAMEIYNESVRDLLSADTTPLRLLDDPERGTVVEKLIEETVRDRNHMIELLSICEAQRQIGETFLNEASSRSHQIIRLTIESSAREFLGKDNSSILTATVDFVDLAGSERASQSLSAGTRLKEGCHINRSLLTLGTVIRKLSKGRSGHVPFRDSKLTRILQPSLGGNARTAVICTMSPARIHVEQSRNTLLFASCAKEVTINAQVNVVMSDKALVKHLQRELARLESELRSPGRTSITAEFAALLREKDIQIEKLEKEIKDLILQRDIAQSHLKELLQVLGDDGDSLLEEGLGHYPKLRVQKSPESGKNHMLEAHDSLAVDVRAFSGGHSRSSSEDQYIQVLNFKENFLQNNTPPRLVIGTSNFSESDSCQEWDEMEKQSNETSEDLCKEVRCIETEDYSSKEPVEPSYLYPDGNIGFPALTVIGNEDKADQESVSRALEKDSESVSLKLTEDRELLSMPSKEDQDIVSPSMKGDRKLESPLMEAEKEFSCIRSVDASYQAKSSLPQDMTKHLSGSRSKTLTKSRSCRARLVTDLSSSCFEKVENNVDSLPNGSDRDFVAEPEDLERKISSFDFGPDVKMILPGKGSHSSTDSAVDIKLEIPNGKSSTDEKADSVDAYYTGMTEKVELQQDKEVTDSLGNENEQRAIQPSKNVKDVGLDPIEDEFKNLSNWPLQFKRLQREIIELWDACNVSLVHRTYFFLLFQGDPTDAIYMEVELRRLSFLRDTFAREETTVLRGLTLSLASSIKVLRQERRKLSKQMLKKLSEQERESLFLKWGIGLNTKLRKLQLAHRLWTSTEDTNHINDSAYLVAKLVGFIEPGQAPKEMFSLDFAPRFATRTYSFKRSLLSLRLFLVVIGNDCKEGRIFAGARDDVERIALASPPLLYRPP